MGIKFRKKDRVNSIRPSKKDKTKSGAEKKEIVIGGVKLTELVMFTKMMSMMLNSGMNIIESLTISQEFASGRLKLLLVSITKSVQSGTSLSKSLEEHQKYFSQLMISSVEIGEASGTLPSNLSALSNQLDKERQLRARLKEVMIYPAIVLGASSILGLGMAIFVLPQITPLFKQLRVDLPFTTVVLIKFSDIMRDYGFIIGPGFIAFVIGIYFLMKWEKAHPVTHWIFLRLPIIKTFSMGNNIARFCRTTGTLLQSGVNIDTALSITEKTLSNYYYKQVVKEVHESVIKGNEMSRDLERYPKLFPKLVSQMIKSGESSGKLDDALLYMADFYEEMVDAKARSLPTILEPVLLLCIGLGVAFLALSIITPIFKATSSVGGQ